MMQSMRRMCMPEIPEEDFVQAIRALCRVEEAWVPDEIGSSLYFRPLAIATTPKLGVPCLRQLPLLRPGLPRRHLLSHRHGAVRIYVEPHYIRAAEGGTGFTKCAGNYAGAALAGDRAEKMGFNQVLWLDGHDRKYVEEMGSMNGFFVIGGELYTAAAAEDHGTILPGVTRRSVIELAKDWGIPVHEGRISIDTITEASRNGRLEEVFATGHCRRGHPHQRAELRGRSLLRGRPGHRPPDPEVLRYPHRHPVGPAPGHQGLDGGDLKRELRPPLESPFSPRERLCRSCGGRNTSL